MSDTPTFARWDRTGPFTSHCITCAEATARAEAAKARVMVLEKALRHIGNYYGSGHRITELARTALETDNG